MQLSQASTPVEYHPPVVPAELHTEEDLQAALEYDLQLSDQLRYLQSERQALRVMLQGWIDEHGGGDFPSAVDSKVIRLKQITTTRTRLDDEGLYKALPPAKRRGLFHTVHVVDRPALEERLDTDTVLREAVTAHLEVTSETRSVRVDLVAVASEEEV